MMRPNNDVTEVRKPLFTSLSNRVFAITSAIVITSIYFFEIMKGLLLQDKLLTLHSIPRPDSDYYLLNSMRLDDLLSGKSPFTNAPIAPQTHLHLGELWYFVPYKLGFSIEQSYILTNYLMMVVITIIFIKMGIDLLESRSESLVFVVTLTFLFLTNTFVRPVSPISHGVILFVFLYFAWKSMISLEVQISVLAFLLGLAVGISYPYFGLWASAMGAGLFALNLYGNMQGKKIFQNAGLLAAFGGVWITFFINLLLIKLQGNKLDTHGTTYLHFPTGYARVATSLIIIFLFSMILRRNFSQANVFIFAALLASPLILLSPVLTGQELEFNSHITLPYLFWTFLATQLLVSNIAHRFKRQSRAMFSILAVFGLLISESSQMNITERFIASLHSRQLIERSESTEIAKISRFLDSKIARNHIVVSIPEELTGILYENQQIKVLSHPHAFFNVASFDEVAERVALNDYLQGRETYLTIYNRELFGNRAVNQCSRLRNYARLMEVIGIHVDTANACTIQKDQKHAFTVRLGQVLQSPMAFVSKYQVELLVVRKNSTGISERSFGRKLLETSSFLIYDMK